MINHLKMKLRASDGAAGIEAERREESRAQVEAASVGRIESERNQESRFLFNLLSRHSQGLFVFLPHRPLARFWLPATWPPLSRPLGFLATLSLQAHCPHMAQPLLVRTGSLLSLYWSCYLYCQLLLIPISNSGNHNSNSEY